MSSVDVTSRSEKQSQYRGAINLRSVSSLVGWKKKSSQIKFYKKTFLMSLLVQVMVLNLSGYNVTFISSVIFRDGQ